MAIHYSCNFNLKDCIKTLGLDEGGRVQQKVAHEILRLSDDYIPFDQGMLKGTGVVEQGTCDVVWDTPYAQLKKWREMLLNIKYLFCVISIERGCDA